MSKENRFPVEGISVELPSTDDGLTFQQSVLLSWVPASLEVMHDFDGLGYLASLILLSVLLVSLREDVENARLNSIDASETDET
jgi:hypothetical protein